MTLNTAIYVLDEVDPYEVFYFCNKLMGAEDPVFTEGHSEFDPPGVLSIRNKPGQGFPAWLDLEYRHDAPLYTEPEYEYYDNDDEDEEPLEPLRISEACYLRLSFDTSYGYRDEFGGCNNLHGRYIVELYRWLAEKGVRLRWQNEYSGEINDGIEGLESFFESGDAAEKWFQESVLPVFMSKDIKTIDKDLKDKMARNLTRPQD